MKKRRLGQATANENFVQGGNQAQTFLLIVLVFVIIFFLVGNIEKIISFLIGKKNENNSNNNNTNQNNTNTGNTTPTIPANPGSPATPVYNPTPVVSSDFPIQRGSSNSSVTRYQKYLFSLYKDGYAENWFKQQGGILGTWGSQTDAIAGWNKKPTYFATQADLDRLIGSGFRGLAENNRVKILLARRKKDKSNSTCLCK